MEQMHEQITDLMTAYYTEYYREQLGLPDWQARVQSRLQEDVNIHRILSNVAAWANLSFDNGLHALVVGGGTGADFLALSRQGCDVYAIEPNEQAVIIARKKLALSGIDPERFIQGVGESLPYADASFDFVWCFTVIEHVQDVRACISEMVRVTKPGGRIYIATPDYRQFYEPHYKMPLPMFAPKWLVKLLLRMRHRPTTFLDSLQFVNAQMLTNIFQELPVVAMQIIIPWSNDWKGRLPIRQRLVKWMAQRRGIQRDQQWILVKQAMSS